MSAFSVENSHDGKIFENYTRFEWGVELGVVAIFMLRLFVPHEFDMTYLILVISLFSQQSKVPRSSLVSLYLHNFDVINKNSPTGL